MVMGVPRQNMEKCSKFAEFYRKNIFLPILFVNKFLKKIRNDFRSILKILKLNQISEFQSYYI